MMFLGENGGGQTDRNEGEDYIQDFRNKNLLKNVEEIKKNENPQ